MISVLNMQPWRTIMGCVMNHALHTQSLALRGGWVGGQLKIRKTWKISQRSKFQRCGITTDIRRKVFSFCSPICPTNRELKYRQRNCPKFPVFWRIPFLNEKYVHHLIFLRFYCKQMRTNILNNILYFYSASSWECKNTKDKYFEKIDKKTKDKYLEKKSWYFFALQVPGTAKNERLPRHCGVQAWRWDLLSGKPKFGDSNQNWDDWIQFWDDTCVGEICRIKCLGQDKWLGFTVPGLRTKSP